jgi:hypothetical protein
LERVWIVSEELAERGLAPAPNRFAELTVVPNLDELARRISEGERPAILAPLKTLEKARDRFPGALALGLLPKNASPDRLLYAVRALLQEAKLQHDLEAAEAVAWSGGACVFDDPSIEFLGGVILGISAARDMEEVDGVLLQACGGITAVSELRVVVA